MSFNKTKLKTLEFAVSFKIWYANAYDIDVGAEFYILGDQVHLWNFGMIQILNDMFTDNFLKNE